MATELSIVISASAMIGSAMSAIRTLTGGLDGVRRSSNILSNEQRRLRGEIDRLGGSTAVPRLQRQYEQLGKTMRSLRLNAIQQTDITTRLEDNRQARANMQSEVMGLVGAGLTLTAPVKLAIDFESSMADVKKVVDFGDDPIIAKQQIQALSDEILKLSSTRPMSATDIAQIVALGGQSGIAKGELMRFADSAVKMGVAFDISAQQAGQSMAELRSAFRLDQQGVETLADKINFLGNSTPAAAKGIMEIVQRVGAFGEVAGFNTGAIAALGASMRGFGIQEEVAATSIKNMMLALGAGENATKSQLGAWKKLGFDHEQIAKDMQVNAEETTLKVLKSISKLEDYEQSQVLESLFGKESLLGIAPLLTSLDVVEKNLSAVKKASNFDGSMNKEYEERAKTTANNIQLLKNNMAHLGITIGSVVLPASNELINDIKPVIESMIGFAKANPVLVATLFKVAAALFAFKAGSLAMRFVFSLLSSGLLSVMGVGLRTAGTIKTLSAAFRLFRLGRAMSALRLFGLSARQARLAIGLFTGGFRLVGSAMRSFGGAIGVITRIIAIAGRAMIANPIILIGMAIAGVAYLIYKNWDTIKPVLVGFWASVTQAASAAWQWLVSIWGGVSAWFGGLWQQVQAVVSAAWSGITSYLSGVWAKIKSLVSLGVSSLLGIIRNFRPVAAFSAAFLAVWSFLSGIAGRFRAFGVNIIQGLIGGIRSMAGTVASAISGVVGNVVGTTKKILKINSPSRVFVQFGSWVSEGLAIGIDKGGVRPVSAIGQLASGITAGFGDKMGNLSAQVSTSVGEYQKRMANSANQAANQGNITINFNPTINTTATDVGKIQTALQLSQQEFEKMFRRMQADKLRRSY